MSPQGHTGSGRKGQRRHTDPTPKPGLLQPRALCNPLPVTYRTVLSRQAVQRSSRAVDSGDPSRGLIHNPATGTGRGGAGPAGRGGAVTRSRARTGGRASGRALCGSEVRRPPRRSAPLGSAPAVPGVGRGARAETQRTGRPLLRHFLPARGFRREREARFCYWFSFLPSLSRDASPTPPPRRWPRCRLWRERSGPSARAAARVGAGGREAAGSGPRRWGGRGVARVQETKLAGCCSVSSSSPLRAQGDRSILNAGSGPGALSFLA